MTHISSFVCLWGYLEALKTDLLLPEGGVSFNVPEILLLDVRDETEYVSARLVTAPMQKPIKDEGGCNDNNRKLRGKKSIGSAWKTLLSRVPLCPPLSSTFCGITTKGCPTKEQLHWDWPVYEKQKLEVERQKILLQFCPTQPPDDVKFWFSSFFFKRKGWPDFPPNTGISSAIIMSIKAIIMSEINKVWSDYPIR